MSGGWIQASVSTAVHGEQPVPMANRSLPRWEPATGRRVARPRGTRSTADAPPAVRRPRARQVRAARPTPNERSAGTSVRNRESASVSSRIHESSTPAGGWNAVQHDRSPEIEPRSDAGDVLRRAGAQLFEEQRFDVSGANAAGRQLVAIPRLGQKRLAAEPHRRLLRPPLRTAGARTHAACCGG